MGVIFFAVSVPFGGQPSVLICVNSGSSASGFGFNQGLLPSVAAFFGGQAATVDFRSRRFAWFAANRSSFDCEDADDEDGGLAIILDARAGEQESAAVK